jgi:uncharacterized membrane protein (DUF441 family)
MTALVLFAVLNSTFRLAVAAILVYKLLFYRDTFNHLERAGLAFGSGTALLTIPVIFDINKVGTPMDGWAGTAFTFAMLLYFLGRLSRIRAHAQRNEEMNERAREHLKERGKL